MIAGFDVGIGPICTTALATYTSIACIMIVRLSCSCAAPAHPYKVPFSAMISALLASAAAIFSFLLAETGSYPLEVYSSSARPARYPYFSGLV